MKKATLTDVSQKIQRTVSRASQGGLESGVSEILHGTKTVPAKNLNRIEISSATGQNSAGRLKKVRGLTPSVEKSVAPRNKASPDGESDLKVNKGNTILPKKRVVNREQTHLHDTKTIKNPLKSTPAIEFSSPISMIPTPIKKNTKLVNNWKNKSAQELSDEEILAMPDSEYMNAVQLAFFRQKLIHLKQSILDNASETADHLRDESMVVPDPTDRATIEEEHAVELRTRDRERKLLKKIEMSIARIDANDYGYCDETGEPIGIPRLLARPTATLSLEAQQRRELKQRMFGD